VYAKDLTIHKGTDNTVFFEFKNPDQKKVPILGKTITFTVFRENDGTTYIDIPVEIHDGPKGIGKVIITEGSLLNIEPAKYNYSVRVVDENGEDQQAYVDDNYGIRGVIDLKLGPRPLHQESVTLLFSPVSGSLVRSSAAQGNADDNHNQAVHTAQFFFSNFTGNIRVFGTLDNTVTDLDNANFFEITEIALVDQTDPLFVNFTGIFSGVRFEADETSGSVTKVLYRH